MGAQSIVFQCSLYVLAVGHGAVAGVGCPAEDNGSDTFLSS